MSAAIDAAIITAATGAPASIESSLGPVADYETYAVGQESGPQATALFLAGGPLLCAGAVAVGVAALSQVAGEKSRGLVGALRTVGLIESAYWLSWFGAYAPLLFVAALVGPAVGAATRLPLFAQVNFGIQFLALALTLAATVAMSLACAACVRAPRAVNVLAFCHLAAAVAVTLTFPLFNVYDAVYLPNVSPAITGIVSVLPFFHYGRMITAWVRFILTGGVDGAASASSDSAARAAAPAAAGDAPAAMYARVLASMGLSAPPGFGASPRALAPVYSWADFTTPPPATTVYVNGLPQSFVNRAPSFNLGMLAVVTVGWLLVAWYASHVSTADDGAAQAPWFFLTPAYWGLRPPPAPAAADDTLARLAAASASERSIRVHKVSKSYAAVTALKEVSLTLAPGAMTALLGQNGAGKSTLLRLLVGTAAPTHGAIFAMGVPVADDTAALRERMGVCPQDDLLWCGAEPLARARAPHWLARHRPCPLRPPTLRRAGRS